MSGPPARAACRVGALARLRRCAPFWLVVGTLVGAAGWEALESFSPTPPFWVPAPEARGRVRFGGHTVLAAGAAVAGQDADLATLRAWAPSLRVAVTSGAGQPPLSVAVRNLPPRARIAASPGVREERRPGERVLTGPAGTAWQFHAGRAEGAARFAVVGDTGASPTFAQALRRAAEMGADFMIVAGDLAYTDGDIPGLRKLLDESPLPVYTLRGNHDYASPARRRLAEALGPDSYAFTWAGTLFVMLDTGRETLPGLGRDNEQYEWLRHVLADPLGYPVLVFTHKPPLARSPEPLGHAMLDRWYARTLVREFERSGVSMVFAGHLHRHETWSRHGVTYVVAGEGKAGAARDPQMAVVDLRGGRPEFHFASIWQARESPRSRDWQGREG